MHKFILSILYCWNENVYQTKQTNFKLKTVFSMDLNLNNVKFQV